MKLNLILFNLLILLNAICVSYTYQGRDSGSPKSNPLSSYRNKLKSFAGSVAGTLRKGPYGLILGNKNLGSDDAQGGVPNEDGHDMAMGDVEGDKDSMLRVSKKGEGSKISFFSSVVPADLNELSDGEPDHGNDTSDRPPIDESDNEEGGEELNEDKNGMNGDRDGEQGDEEVGNEEDGEDKGEEGGLDEDGLDGPKRGRGGRWGGRPKRWRGRRGHRKGGRGIGHGRGGRGHRRGGRGHGRKHGRGHRRGHGRGHGRKHGRGGRRRRHGRRGGHGRGEGGRRGGEIRTGKGLQINW